MAEITRVSKADFELEYTDTMFNPVRGRSIKYLQTANNDMLRGPMPGSPETPIWVYVLARRAHEHEHWGQMDYLTGILITRQ